MNREPISWDDYFMSLAMLVSLRSKDPNTRVGAVLVKDRRVIGTGYNGYPTGCDESRFGWSRDIEKDGWRNTKYPYVIHAEVNALLNSVVSAKDCEIYVTLYPCNECAKQLVQAGIKRVTYMENKHPELDPFVASRHLFEVTDTEVRSFVPSETSFRSIMDTFRNHPGN